VSVDDGLTVSMIHWCSNTDRTTLNYSKNLHIGNLPTTHPTSAGLKSIPGLEDAELATNNMNCPPSGVLKITQTFGNWI
jgi:hypothetical protein